MYFYSSFLNTPTKKQWQRIGTRRRSGVMLPLFSVYSKNSIGIGEIPDIKLMIDWCIQTGLSIIQFLPLNDTGTNFRPYDAESAFALDPMYLSLGHLKDVPGTLFKEQLKALKKEFPTAQNNRANYAVKQAKIDLLWEIYLQGKTSRVFQAFKKKHQYWLYDYAFFRVMKEKNLSKNWQAWPEPFRERAPKVMYFYGERYRSRIDFYQWLQWQLYEQFTAIHQYAREKGVLLMGDLPILVAGDSADVWAHTDYFKLHKASGAPPDAYNAKGQRWGMPPYDWKAIEQNGFDYWTERLKYAENFFDLFRIDHSVGLFRIWTIDTHRDLNEGGLHGQFDPHDESLWENHGRKLLKTLADHTRMLPCAEDLGVVPACSFEVLEELAIPGMDVQRWKKTEDKVYFALPGQYRPNSIATISTHDMNTLAGWWQYEIGTVEEGVFRQQLEELGLEADEFLPKLFDLKKSYAGRLLWKRSIHSSERLLKVLKVSKHKAHKVMQWYQATFNERSIFWEHIQGQGQYPKRISKRVAKGALIKVNQSASVFSIQSVQDWLSLEERYPLKPGRDRVNTPGTIGEHNWTFVLPFSLEGLKRLKINREIKKINQFCGRFRGSNGKRA
ncbi:MAG: 4-alpha-glucanotransferase [Candidatus Omnitrophica bacterium CG11_big_fil_rev_8_21_14_0_20_45_26]|uniref:4-alpha-glucanotransferase n=1 Tax=Candidatus Abzuiibacterium crystallinum TaxID=1974748 RepID=A0A2H0LRF8_9BACT|nr:MAG: 4-alpha-glucanotransferase [Candidatus Omnitrophica bacterium CG11_big_fil_rev_8_21_14_0_20_45_26]PIW64576.1 MAG: 4-alpha-glucanotransferase [Candidatus Omnitrophica bacterium CG12_big_fil_rev_8_21_14_0_65_45_16]